MTPLQRIEKLEGDLKILLERPGDVNLIRKMLEDVSDLKEQEKLLSEIF